MCISADGCGGNALGYSAHEHGSADLAAGGYVCIGNISFKCCGKPDWEVSDRRVYDLVYISCLSPGVVHRENSPIQAADMISKKHILIYKDSFPRFLGSFHAANCNIFAKFVKLVCLGADFSIWVVHFFVAYQSLS